MFMSNFTRSGGRAKNWQSITNLSCCSIEQLTKPFMSMKALAFIMLFAFSSSTMFASEFISGCMSDAPAGPTAEMYANSVECEGDVEVVKSTEMLGDDCSWEVIHSYFIKCDGQDLPTAKIHFLGGDDQAPTLEGELPPNQTGLNLCFSDVPEGPSEADIAALYSDNCSDVTVTKSGTPTGNDCEWSVKYTYTIRDACFNYAPEIEVTISGGDSRPPTLAKNAVIPTGADGLNLCFESKEEGPTEEEIAALFEDNCGNVNVSKNEDSKGSDCKWLAIYTYTIQDDCGNFADPIVLQYSGGDFQDPIINGVPEDMTVSCRDEIPKAPKNITADDNCATDMVVQYSQNNEGLGLDCEGGFVVRTWTVSDDCDHTVSLSQTITVLPAPPAEWVETPANKEITCAEADGYQPELLYYSNGVEGGSCAINGSVEGELSGSFDECGGDLKVTWYFEDDCGRNITYVQDITVLPAPEAQWIDAPQDIQISCEQANLYQAIAIAYSNGLDGACGINGEVLGELSGSYDECGGTLYVDWYFKDDCDRELTHRKTITVEPAPMAEFAPVENDEITCEEANNYAAGTLSYSNNGTGVCLIEGEVQGELSGSYDECGGTLYVDWFFKDDCDREIYEQITITVLPAPMAEFAPVQDDEITCEEANNYAAGTLSYTNNGTGACLIAGEAQGELSGSYDECGGTLYVDWYFKDDCDREITEQITITVLPAPMAEFAPVQDDEISCEEANNYQPDTLSYTNNGTGACLIAGEVQGELSGSYDECGGTLYVDWYFKDDCDREITEQITITVLPAPMAEFEPVDNVSISCEEAMSYQPGTLSYTNNGTGACLIAGEVQGELSGTYDECGGLLFVDWYFKDDCDREISRQIQVKVEPAPPAVFDPVQDDEISCEEAMSYQAGYLGYSNGQEGACAIYGEVEGELSGTFDECGGTLYVDWYFKDDCDREITEQITITVLPAPMAEFAPVQDDEITCEEANNYQAGYLSYSNGLEGACAINGEVLGELSGSYDECGGTLYVDWYFKDDCDREITEQITIYVAPAPMAEFAPVQDDEITCEEANVYAAGTLSYTNNGTGACLIAGEVQGELSGSYDECGGTLYVDWYFKDDCDREITEQITITVLPAPMAEFAPVENDEITCEEANVYAAGTLAYTNNGTGACLIEGEAQGELSGTYDECGGTLYVDWYFKDDCDREIAKRITINVLPAPMAEFAPVENDEITCDEAASYAPGTLSYTNNGTGACLIAGEVQGELSGTYDECGGTLYVDWYFKDDCDREISEQITITVLPAPMAEFAPVQDDEITCEEAMSYQPGSLSYSNGALTDACLIAGEVQGELSGSYDECGGTLYVDWYFKDDCDREITEQITITVLPAPIAEFAPVEDDEITCEEAMSYEPGYLSYTNGQEGACLIAGEVLGELSGSYDECGGTLYVDWYFTDDCGREITEKITIIVLPAPPAVFDDIADTSIPCEDLATYQPEFLGYSNGHEGACEISGEVQGVADPFDGSCGQFDVHFSFTDDCGRTITEKQTITVIDETAPVLVGEIPEGISNMNLCYDQRPDENSHPFLADSYIAGLYSDNCGNVNVTHTVVELGDDCDWAIMYRYEIQDDCDNFADPVKIFFNGGDTSAPELTGNLPEGVTGLQCLSENPGGPDAQTIADAFTDNCGDIIVTPLDPVIVGDDCGWTATYEYIVEDECENKVAENVVIVNSGADTTPPTLDGEIPMGANTLDLCIDSPLGEPSEEDIAALYSDNCLGPITVNKIEKVYGTDCEWIRVFEYQAEDACGNKADLVKVNYQGGDDSAPMPTGVCNDEAFTVYTEDGADCPEAAFISLNVDDEVGVYDLDWTIGGVAIGELGQGVGLLPCFEDNCAEVGELTFRVIGKTTDKGPCSTELTVTFEVEDNCENVSEPFTCTFYVIDNTAPVITCPADVDLCAAEGGSVFGQNDDDVQFVDNTAIPTVIDVPTGETISDVVVQVSMSHTWAGDVELTLQAPSGESILLVADQAGSSDFDTSETITFTDAAAENTTAMAGPVVAGSFRPNDDSLSFGTFISGVANASGTWTLYVGDDAGGDSGLVDFWNIELFFEGTPVDTSVAALGSATATDNCNPNPTVSHSDETIDGQFGYTILRTWTADDGCGNTSECVQTIFVGDDEAPEITCPADVSMEAESGYVYNENLDPVDIVDHTTVTTTVDIPTDSPLVGGYVVMAIEHTWSGDVTLDLTAPSGEVLNLKPDNAGGSADLTANGVYYFYDGAPTNASDMTDDGFGVVDGFDFAPNDGSLSFADFASSVANPNGDWTLSITDDATGDQGTLFAWGLELWLGNDISPETNGFATATDNCSDPSIDYSDAMAYGNIGETIITRTWTATDDAGLTDSCDQIITITDSQIITRRAFDMPGRTEVSTSADVKDEVVIDFVAYPVPFNKEVNIAYTFEFDTNVTIELFDTKGLLIYSQNNTRYTKGSKDVTTFDLSRTANQMFYVKLTTSQGTVTKKIVSSSPNRR